MSDLISKVLVDLALALIPILGGLLAKLILNMIAKTKNQMYLSLAGIAVHWAEDQLGKGEKLAGAAKKLVELSKGKVTQAQATTLVAAAYGQITGALSPLAKGQAASTPALK